MTLTSTQRSTTTHRLELTGAELIDILSGNAVARLASIPALTPNATVHVQVPGGGDYSNCPLQLDEDAPIVITWTTTSERVLA